MRLDHTLQQFQGIPFSRSSLLSVLDGYRRPNDKIASLARDGVLCPLKKGLYVLGPQWRQAPLSLPLVANHLYGPSCVSMEWALAWHGLIPEGVFGVTSVTSRRSKHYETPVGHFSYLHIDTSLVFVGTRLEAVGDGAHCLIAGPTKALCDTVLLTRNLRLSSVAAMRRFLEDDLRVDVDSLDPLELGVVEHYVNAGHKVATLGLLKRVLEAWHDGD